MREHRSASTYKFNPLVLVRQCWDAADIVRVAESLFGLELAKLGADSGCDPSDGNSPPVVHITEHLRLLSLGNTPFIIDFCRLLDFCDIGRY